MENFIFQNPVKLIMGHGMIARLSKEIPSDKRIMITFGGGSVKKNGVYDQVKEALKDHFTIEFWGIEPNPAIETLRKAIALGKEQKVDYLLAVGGGSVIDGTKLISAGLLYDGDAWDLVLAGRPVTKTVPLSTVLTLPATGSEMNNGAVFLFQFPIVLYSRSGSNLYSTSSSGGVRIGGYIRSCDGAIHDSCRTKPCDGPLGGRYPANSGRNSSKDS